MAEHGYTENQIDLLLGLVPALMAHLRRRTEANDADAAELFGALDDYCWHEPACDNGAICIGGKPRDPVKP